MEEGYKSIDNVYKDDEFAGFRKDPRFTELMAAPPIAGDSANSGSISRITKFYKNTRNFLALVGFRVRSIAPENNRVSKEKR